MGTMMLTLLLGASILLVAKIFPGVRNDSEDPLRDQDLTSDTTSTIVSGKGKRPYFTVAIVLVTIWAILSLATASPVILVVALLVLAVGIYLVYKFRHPSLEHRDLLRELLSDLRPLGLRVRDDFWTSFVRLRVWQQERAARLERERAAEQEWQAQERARLERERAAEQEWQAQERARLERIERERRARRYNEHLTVGEYEDIQRRLQREQEQHAQKMEEDRRWFEIRLRDWEKRNR